MPKRREAMKVARSLLDGVGQGQIYQFRTEAGTAGHCQRALQETEIMRLPFGWMRLPAIDELGPTLHWEL